MAPYPGIRRRAALLAGCFAALAAVVQGQANEQRQPPGLPFLAGVDLSAAPQYEDAGVVYRDGGEARPLLQIFRDHGANAVRLRLFVQPTGHGEAVNNLTDTIALARRAKALGYYLLLDLHYSDTWADPGHQQTPAAWQALKLPELAAQVHDYTAQVLAAMAKAGVAPDMVQIGNEINNGLLRPLGALDDHAIPPAQAFDRVAALLTAGADAVREAGPARIMIHLANGERTDRTVSFFDAISARHVPFDVIGLSYYPARGGTLGQLTTTLDRLATRFHKPVVVVETAYPRRPSDARAGVAALTWPQTPEGQKQYLLALTETLRAVPGGLGAGFFYWHPEAVPAGRLPLWQRGDMSLFDEVRHDALPALDAFAPAEPAAPAASAAAR
ncbi:MAG: glycosyl hydrolase 53 family protein [Verrucomicrobiota bacterium]